MLSFVGIYCPLVDYIWYLFQKDPGTFVLVVK